MLRSTIFAFALSLCAATPQVTPGLQGEYWGPGATIPAAPGVPAGAPNLTRVDATVDFANATFPAPYAAADNFVVRWTGFVLAPITGTVTFFTNTDDGVELRVNSQILINDWQDQSPVDNQGALSMVQDTWVPIQLTFYERGGGAECHLSWSYGAQARIVIPSTNLSATPPPPPTPPTLSISTPQNFTPIITLTWTAVTGATAYNILRSNQSGTETAYATVGAPATSFTDTGVVFQQQYFYVVRTVIGTQVGLNSNEVSGTPQSLPPRTQPVGGEDDECGCGSTEPPGAAAAAAVIAALLLLCFFPGRNRRGSPF
jgi:hypothetical protein